MPSRPRGAPRRGASSAASSPRRPCSRSRSRVACSRPRARNIRPRRRRRRRRRRAPSPSRRAMSRQARPRGITWGPIPHHPLPSRPPMWPAPSEARTRACPAAAAVPARVPRPPRPPRTRAPSRVCTPVIPTRPFRLSLSLLLALALLTAALRPSRAWAGDADAAPRDDEVDALMQPEARALYDRGLAAYQAKDYPTAIRAFEAGFALEPRREFLFANAQARRLAGDCRGAVPLYQRFLEMGPPPVQASATQIALARCAQQMAVE